MALHLGRASYSVNSQEELSFLVDISLFSAQIWPLVSLGRGALLSDFQIWVSLIYIHCIPYSRTFFSSFLSLQLTILTSVHSTQLSATREVHCGEPRDIPSILGTLRLLEETDRHITPDGTSLPPVRGALGETASRNVD